MDSVVGRGLSALEPSSTGIGSGASTIRRPRVASFALAVGVAILIAVVAWQGLSSVTAALAQAGWGLLAVAILHLPLIWADAMGWRCLLPAACRPRIRTMVWARWVGESMNDLLPVLQMGGNVAKAHILARRGLADGVAGASVVVDVTLVVLTQIIFTVIGLAVLLPRLSGGPRLVVVLGTALLATLLAGFYVAQRRGFFTFVARISKRLLGSANSAAFVAGAAAIDAEVLRLYTQCRVLIASGAWHIASWFLGIGEIWVALRLLGHPVDLSTALLFESLGQAVRTGAFAVPGALGIQEGGYVLIGQVLGIEPPVALALSLARRVREILIGLPGLAAWQSWTLSGALRVDDSTVTPRWRVEGAPVVRALNGAGRLANTLGLRLPQLDPEALVRTARRRTRLHDFGEPAVEEPLRRLVTSLVSESKLNPMGQIATRADLIRLLSNRLRLEEDRKLNPGIAAEEIRRPLVITGLPRTGTTLLHKLIALDPTNRVPLTWECMHPSPPPHTSSYQSDPRIQRADGEIAWFHRLVRGFNRIHPVGAALPEECIVITSHSFVSYQFETTHLLPSYLEWLKAQDLRASYEVHRRFLQHLQWRCPGERWVLKAPAHLFDLGALFTVYPDACVVMTHRDPVEVAASNASLTATLRSAFCDDVDPLHVGPECSRTWAEASRRALTFRDGGTIAAERFFDLSYDELVKNPLDAVRRVYTHFALPFPQALEDRVEVYLRENPSNRFGKHRYSLAEFGLTLDGEDVHLAAYRERFGV